MTHAEIEKELEAMDRWAKVLADEIQKDKKDAEYVLVVAIGKKDDIHARAIGDTEALQMVCESFKQEIEMHGTVERIN